MGSIRRFLDEMSKTAGVVNPAEAEANGFNDILAKVAFLKMAQDAAVAEALAEEAAPEEMAEEEGAIDEEAISEALSEIIDNVDELGDEDKEAILEAADQLEDAEAMAGEKTASVMDYVRLMNWLNV